MGETATYRVLEGDAVEQLRTLPDGSVHCVVTSPPYYGLRDYGVAGQIGLEATPAEYVMRLVEVFREVKRVLRDDGTLWLNLGDSYVGTGDKGSYRDPKYAQGRNGQEVARNRKVAGLPAKNLIGIPWRVAFALQDDGWILRSDIIWAKDNPMPESVKDRPTRSHEYVFLFAKKPRYYYDAKAIAESSGVGDNGSYFDKGKTSVHPNQGCERRDKQRRVGKRQYVGFNERWDAQEVHSLTRNRRSVWHVNTAAYAEAHFAVFPEKLVEPMILAGCPAGGTVLDPFAGSGTTLAVANRLGRHAVGIELNPAYVRLIEARCAQASWILREGEQ